jgi:uncharacterized tellurite resistance protein B-like protein
VSDSIPTTTPSKECLLDRIRFEPEREMQESIFRRFGVLEGQDSEDVRRQAVRSQDEIRATHLKIDERTAPRIHAQLEGARSALETELEIELYLENSVDINAAAYARPDASRPCLITLTSGAVRQFDDQQLRMLLGHEIGHLHYRHSTHSMEIGFAFLSRQRPDLLDARLRIWNRMMEISADRAELIASGNDFDAFFRTNLLLHTGLGPAQLNPSVDDILCQIGQIKRLKVKDQLGVAFDTHPLMPIRIRAAQVFNEAYSNWGDKALQYETEEEIGRLARLMDYETQDPAIVHQREFILAGGILLCKSDQEGEITDGEREMMEELVLPFTDDPDRQFKRIQTFDEAVALLTNAANWIAENLGQERYEIFNKLLEIAVADGDIDSAENKTLIDIADLLSIPAPVVEREVAERVRLRQAGENDTYQFDLRSH